MLPNPFSEGSHGHTKRGRSAIPMWRDNMGLADIACLTDLPPRRLDGRCPIRLLRLRRAHHLQHCHPRAGPAMGKQWAPGVDHRGGSGWPLFSCSWSWDLPSSSHSSTSYDIGLPFTPARSTEARTSTTTSGPASVPTSARQPSSVRSASGYTPVSVRSTATPRVVGGSAITHSMGHRIFCAGTTTRTYRPRVPRMSSSLRRTESTRKREKRQKAADQAGRCSPLIHEPSLYR